MFVLGLVSLYVLFKHIFKTKIYADYLVDEYNKASIEYNTGHMFTDDIKKKEFVLPDDPEFWNML